MNILQLEWESIADYYKNHIRITLTGFVKTLELIDAINLHVSRETVEISK